MIKKIIFGLSLAFILMLLALMPRSIYRYDSTPPSSIIFSSYLQKNLLTHRQLKSINSLAGAYHLHSGTMGCPISIEWTPACHGFVLNVTTHDGTFKSEKFCSLNEGKQTQTHRKNFALRKITTTSSFQDQVLQKRTYTDDISPRGIKLETVAQEDTLILNQSEQILWEHSLNGQGYSCLFSKTAKN